MTLPLTPMPGEAPTERVWGGAREGYSYWLKLEYAGASWDWTILSGDRPVAFGVAADQAAAVLELEAAMLRVAPPPPAGGVAGLLGRLLWGSE